MSLARIMEEEARLRILEILAAQRPNQSLSSSMLHSELVERWGMRRSRDWVHLQIAALAELGAVTVLDLDSVKIASLTDRGAEHLQRIIALPGVRPAPRPEA